MKKRIIMVISMIGAGLFVPETVFAAPGKLDVDKYVYTKYFNSNTTSEQTAWGALNCHDPKLFQDDDGTYYVYSTDAAIGGAGQKGIQIRKSTDLVHWQSLGTTAIQNYWDKDWQEWVSFDYYKSSSWAPTVIKQNGLYYMFHGIITEERVKKHPDAAISLAIASSAEGPFYPAAVAAMRDETIGKVLKELGVEYKNSNLVRYSFDGRDFDFDAPDSVTEFECLNTGRYDTHTQEEMDFSSWSNGFGCIDPEFVTDVATGKQVVYEIGGRKCYGVTYGSWKGGIALVYVDAVSLKPVTPEGKELDAPADSEDNAFGIAIAGGYGAAYEGAQVIYNSDNGWYYCFVSMGYLEHEYRVGVGRSKEVTGPYIDAGGRSMYLDPSSAFNYHEIGSKIIGGEVLRGRNGWRCPGGQSILRTQDGKVMFACHARTNFRPGYFFFLQVRQMFFTPEGWPVLNHNEYYADNTFAEKLEKLKAEEVAGTYDVILTVRNSEMGKYTPFGDQKPVDTHIADAVPTPSVELVLNADGTVSGDLYAGSWSLMPDGYSIEINLTYNSENAGCFKGYVLKAVDWAIKNPTARKTISFTTIDASKTGEYLWGNKRI